MLPLATDTCTDKGFFCQLALDTTNSESFAKMADVLVGKPMAILGLVLLALAIRWALFKVVDRVINRAETAVLPERTSFGSGSSGRRAQRAKTMGSLFKSIITGVLIAIFGTMILDQIGLNIAPIIASAGIIGLAIGFGAQSLVKDFLSGIFMIFEDQYGVGDVVDLGEATGTIEAVSLRVTRLRDVNGTVWYVPNGEIMRVGNQSQNWARTVLDISVGYHEDLARVRRILMDVAHDLWVDDDYQGVVIEEPSVWGVEALGADGVTVRVTLKTAPLQQWAVAREMRQRIKARFDYEGIEIPFPQRVVWSRTEPTAPTRQGAEDADNTSA